MVVRWRRRWGGRGEVGGEKGEGSVAGGGGRRVAVGQAGR